MTRFVESAIIQAGLGDVLIARRAGLLDVVRSHVQLLRAADLMAVGALADLVRAEEVGPEVRVHGDEISADASSVTWVAAPQPSVNDTNAQSPHGSELALLREIAVTRITSERGARIGVDWTQGGIELAQVALGFGASDLRGPIQRKSGVLIREGEKRKLKGLGMVEVATIKRREIASLISYAGRIPVFVDREEAEELGDLQPNVTPSFVECKEVARV